MAEQMTKQQREAAARRAADERRLAAFIDKGNPDAQGTPTPAAAPIASPEPAQAAQTPENSPAEPSAPVIDAEAPADGAQAAPEPVSEPAEAAAETEAPAAAAKPASKGKKGKDAGLPWADAHPRVKVNFSTQFSEEQHMKLTWLAENMTGRQSIQKLVHEAVDALLDKRIKEILK